MTQITKECPLANFARSPMFPVQYRYPYIKGVKAMSKEEIIRLTALSSKAG
ncbi:hypothetical protein AAEO50_07910 [Rossellomorea oryzaecorticis]|uniref:Uncharacterized protein n=1 Tax=Rossellomorea oryzaecorticis TaxID=1396505 RepID=A0ABU9KAE5_9BACI